MDRFDKFTDRAQKALTLAQQTAQRYRSAEVQPEHIFLGMLELGEGVDIMVLRNLQVDPLVLITALEARLTKGTEQVTGPATFSASSKKLIESAVQEARRLNHSYIGKEHLLLAQIRDAGRIPAEVLREHGVTYDVAQPEVTRVLMARGPKELKRYNLALPEDLFREVEQLAQRQNTTVVEVLRRFVKLGLYVTAVQESPDGAIVVREGGREREIVIL